MCAGPGEAPSKLCMPGGLKSVVVTRVGSGAGLPGFLSPVHHFLSLLSRARHLSFLCFCFHIKGENNKVPSHRVSVRINISYINCAQA